MQSLPPNSIYLTLIIAAITIGASPAQIVYTDVIPDQTINHNGVYQLDLNNDAITDFNITYTVAYPGPCSDIAQLNYFIRITPANSNSTANDSINPLWPVKLDSNNIIGKNLIWKRDPNQLLFSMTWQCPSEYWVGDGDGYWINTQDNFLPLKLRLAGHTYFGWLGIDVQGYPTSFGSFTIKDYAFNSIPAHSILAGETSCGEPEVTVTAGGPLSFCSGDSVTLTANTTAYKFQWVKNGVNITGATSSSYVATTDGSYRVKALNSCGCKSSKNKIVTTPCKLNQHASLPIESGHLSVYPNPAAKTITIDLLTNEESTIQIINHSGEVVFTARSTSEEVLIDVNSFAPGIYTVRWINGENSESKTFSVVK